MSALLENNWHFLNYLLTTDGKHQRWLISNLSREEVDVITEIFYNIGHVVDLNSSQRKYMKKYLKVIKSLSKVKRARKNRKASIKKYAHIVIKILNKVKDNILQVNTNYINNHVDR